MLLLSLYAASCHMCRWSQHTHHAACGWATPLCSAVPCCKISQADTQWYNAILVFESLDLGGEILHKSQAAEMQHVSRLCPVGTLISNRSCLW